MLNIKIVALTRLAAVAAKTFAASGKGAIVNLASAMAFLDTPAAAAYAASKAYVLNPSPSLDLDATPTPLRPLRRFGTSLARDRRGARRSGSPLQLRSVPR